MPEPNPALLTIGDIAIDVAGRRLLRNGVEQPLEPKAFAVLALLASKPGHVFTRDEILDAVWEHRHVTPGVLNRIATLLRQALGEDAQSARLLHTVHGVGYRFDLPVEAVVTPPVPVDIDDPVATVSDKTDGGHDAPSAPGQPSRRRSAGRIMTLLVVIALVAAAAGFIYWQQPGASGNQMSPGSADTAARSPTLIVMPLKPIGAEPDSQVIAEGLTEELICNLARIDGLRVIAHASTLLAASAAEVPERMVERLGISHVLEGNLQQSGQSLRIRLRLMDVHSRETRWVKDFDRTASEVLVLQREIASAVATSLALTMGLVEGTESEGGNVDYLRRYLAAGSLLRRGTLLSAEAAERAETEFRALIRERPADARARAGLLLAMEIRAYRRPELADALRRETLDEAVIVQRLDPDQPESWYVQGLAACRGGNWETCIPLLDKARTLASPSSSLAFGLRYGYALQQLGYLDRGEAAHRDMVARDPINPERSFGLARVLDTQGRHDEALSYFDPQDPYQWYGRWFNAVWRNKPDEALDIAERLIGSNPQSDSMGAQLQPCYTAVSHALADPSSWPQAIAAIETCEASTRRWNFTRVLVPGAERDAADIIRQLEALRRRGFSTWDLLLWTKPLAWLRRDPAFQDHLRDSGILAYWQRHGFPTQCRPDGDGAACD